MENALRYIINRLKEGSTWRGIFALLTAVGVSVSPDKMEAIITAGLSLIGVVGVFWPEKKSVAPPAA